MSSGFKPERVIEDIVPWIRGWFQKNGDRCTAVIGISGGKDSAVAAALCAKALGSKRVLGVIMPNIVQPDINDAVGVCKHLDIRHCVIPVTAAVADTVSQIKYAGIDPSSKSIVKLPSRIRMATLYAVAQSVNGRVINTNNLSERWIGKPTLYGDSAGDLKPLAGLTSSEVVMIGRALGFPERLIAKPPSDGLMGRTDEDRYGFSYSELDQYIRTGKCKSQIVKNKIDRKKRDHMYKLHKPDVYALREEDFKAFFRKLREVTNG